jgi:hypothetical protein
LELSSLTRMQSAPLPGYGRPIGELDSIGVPEGADTTTGTSDTALVGTSLHGWEYLMHARRPGETLRVLIGTATGHDLLQQCPCVGL